QGSDRPADHSCTSTTPRTRYLGEGVSRTGTLLLDFGPMPDGQVQGESLSRLRVLGDWLRRNGDSVYGAGPGVAGITYRDPVTMKGDTLYLHVFGTPEEDTVQVTNLNRRVLSARVLATGRPLEWDQQLDFYYGIFLKVRLPAAYRDPYDTVIALELAPETYPPAHLRTGEGEELRE